MTSSDFDYSIFYKKKYSTPDQLKIADGYDLFISAFNDSYRVKQIFEDINAVEKHWLIFPEYDYPESERPIPKGSAEKVFVFQSNIKEGDIIREYITQAGIKLKNINKICVDITGFIRPHLIFFVRYCYSQDVKQIDFVYTDPIKYKKKENTDFSFDYVDVRQIDGCQGVHNPETNNDILIIGSGYDHLRITDVSKKKNNSKKIQLFGFPSLQPDMYQENILKAYKAEEETSNGRENFIDKDKTLFAPANDPFITANVIKNFVIKEDKKLPITNLYLCPLSTKAQTLGLALYYVAECIEQPVSIIFPVCNRYSRETTEGISKIWKFTVEFDSLKTVPVAI